MSLFWLVLDASPYPGSFCLQLDVASFLRLFGKEVFYSVFAIYDMN